MTPGDDPIAESCQSRGILAGLFRRSEDTYKLAYNHDKDGSACRIYGSFSAKRITGTSPCFSNATLIEVSLPSQPPCHCTRPCHDYSSHIHAVSFPAPIVNYIFTNSQL